ncbi:Uncharacterised protein [Mycobacteroides abscessus subsp. massiliense]|nr:Uncharacterised protein [Mycobacteroides abscessus subsp. massiliense]SKD35652.1 Uncharacterised protein [Mycobacteroides abscessus subsp. massiliense]SKD47808.1 Uncharacterised protein [Mycobacteroides abscessus subsp. massiliense]SKD66954.1 Uncharacterised protein [Mycobacteroides abscessus subsp. massiliense]SLD73080.1 Uncharacterised protein [Mycobacteroides abscessus subsp. massiliense]
MHARATDGATADVTLNEVAWIPNCRGSLPCVSVKLTLAGSSSLPFKYNESFVVGCYATTAQPWVDADHKNCPGADPMINYASINRLPPLRLGSLVAGQVRSGYVAIPLGSRARWYIELNDPESASPEAAWVVEA